MTEDFDTYILKDKDERSTQKDKFRTELYTAADKRKGCVNMLQA